MKFPISAALLTLLAVSACTPQKPQSPTPRTKPAEIRALWVVRNTITQPDSIKAMVQRAQENGFNTLIVQVRGRGDAFYNARWEPRSEALSKTKPGFDPLALTIKEAHARGLTVHAWLNTSYLMGMDNPSTDPKHMYNMRPDLLAVPHQIARELYTMDPRDPQYRAKIIEWSKTARDRIEGVYMSPAAPEMKEHIYSMWMDILDKYDVDGLNFDYVRYAAPDLDYSKVALDRFRFWMQPQLSAETRAHFDALAATDPIVYADSFPTQFDEFRRTQITELVERVYFGVKKRAPNVIVSADVFGNSKDAYNNRFQDWTNWLKRGFLDVAALMAYSRETPVFKEQIRVAVEAGGPDRVWAGIGSYRIPAESTIEKIQAARDVGAKGIVLFSYDSAVRKSELNPNADYLKRVMKGAFTDTRITMYR